MCLVRSAILNLQAAAQAQAKTKPSWAWAQSSGLKIVEPRPSKAKPKPGLSGRARPAHHYELHNRGAGMWAKKQFNRSRRTTMLSTTQDFFA